MEYSEWGRLVEERFPAIDSEDVDRRWQQVQHELMVDQLVTGIVIAKAPFGAWIDIGVGFPALLEIICIQDLTPRRYQDDDWCPIGSYVAARIGGFVKSGHQIYLWQVRPGQQRLSEINRLAAIPTWPIYRLTVAHYEEISKAGILNEHSNLELLEGWLVPKKVKTPLHDSSVDLLAEQLVKATPHGWYRRVQNSLVTSDSCPEPDITVVRGRPADYQRTHPTANDCAIVIEVADIAVSHDRRKAAIYARAGVPEFWLVNLVDWQLERMTQPLSEGMYQQTQILTVSDAVPLLIPGAETARISLQEFLTPPA